jgi:uncharacterized protein (TIGR02246 family)
MRNNTRSRRFICVLAALVACALNSPARASLMPVTDAADEAAVRENVRQMEIGWNAKSAALYAKPFAADADFVVVNGMHLRGRAAIEKSHQQIFDTFYKNSTLSVSVKQIRFLRPDVAVVHVSGKNRVRQGDETHVTDVIVTLVMLKEKGVWKIVAFQNTRVLAEPSRPAGEPRR